MKINHIAASRTSALIKMSQAGRFDTAYSKNPELQSKEFWQRCYGIVADPHAAKTFIQELDAVSDDPAFDIPWVAAERRYVFKRARQVIREFEIKKSLNRNIR